MGDSTITWHSPISDGPLRYRPDESWTLAAPLLGSESRMQISGVGVNPSRSALLQFLKQGRADISEEAVNHAG